MALLDDLVRLADTYRVLDLERLDSNELIEGDFSGSVTGKWVRLDATGSGVVEYNSKLYFTKPIGFTSIPKGTAVELSYAKGVYYSKW